MAGAQNPQGPCPWRNASATRVSASRGGTIPTTGCPARLRQGSRAPASARTPDAEPVTMNAHPPPPREVSIPVGRVTLPGTLTLPVSPRGIVLFAHGSGSSRHSPRNRFVADVLVDAGVATLLFDLLTPAEDRNYQTRFDIPLLTTRLTGATAWLATEPALAALPVGYFGASTGAAAALDAAAVAGSGVRAVVSRGGRPDLAGSDALSRVTAPTLLLVGGDDDQVIELNRAAKATHALRVRARDRAGRDAPVRGARNAGGGRGRRARLVRSAVRASRQRLTPMAGNQGPTVVRPDPIAPSRPTRAAARRPRRPRPA